MGSRRGFVRDKYSFKVPTSPGDRVVVRLARAAVVSNGSRICARGVLIVDL
jgi:hypothetical protein